MSASVIRKTQSSVPDEISPIKSWLTYAFDEKTAGASDQAIIEGLMDQGMPHSNAVVVVEGIESTAHKLIEHWGGQMWRGLLFLAGGILITFISYASTAGNGIYLVAWGAMLFGGVRFFKAIHEKRKFDHILQRIEGERTTA
jgi:hypothetical protein